MPQGVNRIPQPLIASELASAATLPSRYYFDPQYHALDKQQIFSRTWQVVGRASQLASPGDYFTTDLAGESLLLVRDNDRRLRGFYNVCRHRAGPPAEGCGSRKVFRCGYHGWTYGLDGCLISAPEFEGVRDFRGEEFGLVPIRVEQWLGLVLVNLDAAGPPLLETLGRLPEQIARFRFEHMRFYTRHDYFMDCNWKTYIDNYLEGYHLPSVHPGLNRELDYGEYTTHLYPGYSLQTSPIRAAADSSGERRYQNATGGETADYYWIFPNWMLNCYPDNVSLNIVLPLGPERCVGIFEWYFPEAVMATETPERTVQFSHEIQLEDARICEVVQRNLNSQSYSRGRYSVKQESGLHHFHSLYSQAIQAPPSPSGPPA